MIAQNVLIRPARPDDAAALASMFGRCSEQTRHRRFHGLVTEMPASYVRRCLGREEPAQNALVAQLMTGALVGLASAGPLHGVPHIHEACALIEDGWQRRGIGRMLVAEVIADACSGGAELIRLEMCREQPSLLAYVIAHAPVVSTSRSGYDMTTDIATTWAEALRGRTSRAAGRAR